MAPSALARLPSPADLAELEACAAACFGSEPALTVAVPGSDLGLRLVAQVLAAQRPAAVVPGYSGHTAMWPQGCQPVAGDPAALLAAAGVCDALVLARPGNPGGEVVAADALGAIAARLAARGGWLIVDEAFADAAPALAISGQGWPNLITLRSFGKFAGLAGLRLGFVIAPPALAEQLRAWLGDWPIAAPALAAGLRFYADTGWQAAQRARLADSGQALDAVLDKAGLTITARTPFFRTCKTGNAWALFEHCARSAILTRPFADDPTRLRIGLPPDAAATQRLENAFATWGAR